MDDALEIEYRYERGKGWVACKAAPDPDKVDGLFDDGLFDDTLDYSQITVTREWDHLNMQWRYVWDRPIRRVRITGTVGV